MKNKQTKRDIFFLTAILITAANVMLVWAFRFLPLYDYPIWLYEVRIMRAISQPQFSAAYDLAGVPVPNLGFVGIVYLLSFIVPVEVAGKIVLTICVIGLPWSFWYCLRRLSGGTDTPLAYAAFPFAFSLYFFSGQAFLLGFIVMLLLVGLYLPKLNRLSFLCWTALSFLFLLCFFIHALSFVLTIIVLGGALLFHRRRSLLSFGLTLVPSLFCLIWYLMGRQENYASELRWSIWGLAQNGLKPLFLFTKSYGIPNPLPLTVLNLLWLGLISWLAYQLWKREKIQKQIGKEFIISFWVILFLTIALPEILFGIVQPGSRFALPALLLMFLMYASVQISEKWKVVFLAIAAVVTIYNTYHFRQVDEQMNNMFIDLTSTVGFHEAAFCSVRFDWPPERKLWDVGAASIDPLFGVPYYAGLKDGGPAWIFGTSLLRVKDAKTFLQNIPRGSTPDDLAASVLNLNMAGFSIITLVGNNTASRKTYAGLLEPPSQFIYYKQRDNWSILGTLSPRSNERQNE